MGLDAVVSAVISGFLKRLCAGDSDEGLNCPLNTRLRPATARQARNDAKEMKAPEEKTPFHGYRAVARRRRVVGVLQSAQILSLLESAPIYG